MHHFYSTALHRERNYLKLNYSTASLLIFKEPTYRSSKTLTFAFSQVMRIHYYHCMYLIITLHTLPGNEA